jgi:chromosome segregation protein
MRLESVVLKGFKSFAEKTVVRILPGVTGIVGPNGCGKSNISEAVRWALGEQSAKSLRGTRMEDLIFHGSASRKPIGLAEVELVFSNDGALAVPWSEVAVGRRLYRTGESEYLLNSEPSRLRDILDLLAGTGASSRAYSVMDQEKLNHVLTAKPYERRIFIEEAAGIARYKQQRHETQGKLDATRQNLLRVRDVMDEVKRQLGSLERQARKAQQYKVLHGERQGIALALVAADHARLRAEGERLGSERERLRADEEQLRGRLAALAATEAARRATLQETDYRLSDLRQGLQKARSEFARVLERRDQIGVQLHELGQEDVRLAEDVRLTEARIEAVAAERQAKVSGLREAEVLAGQTSLRADELQAELEVLRSAIAGDRTRLESLRLEQVRMAAERVDLTRSTGELRERESQLDRRRVRLEEELAEAQRASCALLAELTAGEAERARTLETLVWLEQEQALVASFVADCERRIALTQARLGDARVRVAARRSSLEALEQLERAREGCSRPATGRAWPACWVRSPICSTCRRGWSRPWRPSSASDCSGSWWTASTTRAGPSAISRPQGRVRRRSSRSRPCRLRESRRPRTAPCAGLPAPSARRTRDCCTTCSGASASSITSTRRRRSGGATVWSRRT